MLALLLSSVCLLSGAARGELDELPAIGERLPPLVVEGLANTGARSFAEFYGRAVLIEFFAYWSGPSAEQVARLNGLDDTLRTRGLSVLGITREGPMKTAPWIAKHDVRYAYGYDPDGAVHALFHLNDFPYEVLLDPTGTVVWHGLPRRLDPADIERALAGGVPQPVWEWPEEARVLAPLLHRGAYAAARALAETLPASGSDPRALVEGEIARQRARFELLLEQGDAHGAFRLAEHFIQDLGTLPEASALAAHVAELQRDPAVQQQLAASARLAELERRKRAVRGQIRAKKLREDVRLFLEANPGSPLEPRARRLFDAMERYIARAPRNP